jgi:hypothetical protein
MINRSGKECKMINCKNYKYYSSWNSSIGSRALEECRNCKYAHVSQYQKSK